MPVYQFRKCRRRSISETLDSSVGESRGSVHHGRMGFLRRCLPSPGSSPDRHDMDGDDMIDSLPHLMERMEFEKPPVALPRCGVVHWGKQLEMSSRFSSGTTTRCSTTATTRHISTTAFTCTTSCASTNSSCASAKSTAHSGQYVVQGELEASSQLDAERDESRDGNGCDAQDKPRRVHLQPPTALPKPRERSWSANAALSATAAAQTRQAEESKSDGDLVRSAGKHKRGVSFTSIEVRDYAIVLGDHPSCSCGPPISLGWDYSSSHKLDIDEYEGNRGPRRTVRQMAMDYHTRKDLLINSAGYTEAELRKAERRMTRVKTQRSLGDLFDMSKDGE